MIFSLSILSLLIPKAIFSSRPSLVKNTSCGIYPIFIGMVFWYLDTSILLFKIIFPLDGFNKPQIISTKVVFPVPEIPLMPMLSLS